MKNSRFLICLVALLSTIAIETQAHRGANTHHLALEVIVDCPNIEKYKNEISAHDADYERIKSDLHQGLFCTECKSSKTEIERSGEPFDAHLRRVGGKAYSATKEMFDKKYETYLSKRKNIERNLNSAIEACNRQKEAEKARIEAEKTKAAEEAEQERLRRIQEEEDRRRREEELRRQKLLEFRTNMSQLQQLALNAVRTQSQEILDRQRESLAEFKGKLFGKSITYSNPILDEGSQLIKTTLDQKITETVIDDDNFNGDLAEPIFSLPNAWKSLKEKDILGFFQGLGFTKPLNYWQNRGLETVDQVGNDLVKDYSSLMDRLFIESNDLDPDQADVMVDDVINRVKKNLLNIIPGLGDLWYSTN